jgi:anaerobic dimethyl sulfoxide reductase subunit C (anchor subunit)
MNVREWALPVYTVLMQLAAGALLVLWVIRTFSFRRFTPDEMDRITRNPILVIAFTIVSAMVGAHFHLSKPFHSYLAILNLAHSWLSREILFTVLFFLAVSVLWLLSRSDGVRRSLITGLGWLAVVFGHATVYCMARIYLLPTQVAWNSTAVIISFFTTTLLLGIMTIACLMVLDLKFAEVQKVEDIAVHTRAIRDSFGWLALIAGVMVIVSMTVIFYQINDLQQGGRIARTSLDLLFNLYLPLFIMRLVFLVIAPLWMGYAVYRMFRVRLVPTELMIPVYLSCLLVLIGEIVGRFLFYATHIRLGV